MPLAPILASAPELMPVSQLNNHVFFYGEVDTHRCNNLIETLYSLTIDIRWHLLAWQDAGSQVPALPIWLHIHSGGGELMPAWAVADTIERLATTQVPIYTVVEGESASAATIISMAGTKRWITPHSLMLIHQLSDFAYGEHDKMVDRVDTDKKLMEMMMTFYLKRSRLKRRQLEQMLAHDTSFTTEQAMDAGLVDEVLAA